MKNQKTTIKIKNLGMYFFNCVTFISLFMSGNLMSQVSNIPAFKPTVQSTGRNDAFTKDNIFDNSSSQNQISSYRSDMRDENSTPKNKTNYSVSERKQEKIIESKSYQPSYKIIKFNNNNSNNNESGKALNSNQPVLASQTSTSNNYNQQKTPFQELIADNQQTIQKTAPTTNPGDPGELIPVGDGTILLLLALAFYTIIKFKNL